MRNQQQGQRMSLLESLQWRYATKRMNGNIIPRAKLDNILEAINLSASSLGLQPYSVIVIDDPALKAEISKGACQQPQILESSHLLVFAAWTKVSAQKVDDYIQHVAEVRGAPIDALAGFKQMILGTISSRTDAQIAEWTARQTYIALGTGLAAAAVEQVDATPMEGFNPQALDQILNLGPKDLHSTLILALGYRDAANDQLAVAPKVRRESSKLFIRNR